ncbi:MAG: hypothetical protein ABI697_08430 [Devosia sp.]
MWMFRSIPSMLLALLLTGCASVGLDTAPATPRALDTLNDDLGALVIALDMPRGVGAVEGGTALTLDLGGPRPQHLRAPLVEADADAVAATLPPPGTGRAYYFLSLAPADQVLVRTLQQSARNSAVVPVLAVVPKYCVSGPLDLKSVTVAVLGGLPGRRLSPLVERATLAQVAAGSPLPACS